MTWALNVRFGSDSEVDVNQRGVRFYEQSRPPDKKLSLTCHSIDYAMQDRGTTPVTCSLGINYN